MLLAIDTATRWLGLALFDESGVAAEWGWRCRNQHSVELAPAVARMLDAAGIGVADLRGIGVAIGPGSYTGLRIGLGFAKGLGLAHALPLLGIPTLDIVAAAQPEMAGKLLVVAAAGRGRVLAGPYRWQRGQGWRQAASATIHSWDELLAEIAPPVVLVGEITPAAARQIHNHDRRLRLLPATANTRRPAMLAQLAWTRLENGERDDPATLAPFYLRNPDGTGT